MFWRSAPLLDEHGGTRGIIAGGIDITARHEEAAAREREREFLNTIANEAPSLLLLIDENGVIEPRGSNKAFERELEVKPDETPGTVLWDDYVAPGGGRHGAATRATRRSRRDRRRPRQHLGDEERPPALGAVVVPSSFPPSTSGDSSSSAAGT